MALDLTKRTGKLTLSLTKRNIAKIVAQVCTVVDRSGSMDHLYDNGTMQEYMNRMIPLGLKFDDNGQIDNFAFTTASFETGPVTADNVETFIRDVILPIRTGGTAFSPVLKDVEAHYFGEATKTVVTKKAGLIGRLFGKADETAVTAQDNDKPLTGDPVYLIFQTDGEIDRDDQYLTDQVLARLEHKGIYIQFVGIDDDADFGFLERMGDKYSNVGFMHIEDLSNIDDEALYDLLINEEFKTFLKTRFPNNITEIK